MKHLHQGAVRAFVLGAATFSLLGMAQPSAIAQEVAAPEAALVLDPEVGEPELVMVEPVDRKRVVYDLVADGLRVTSYDNTSVATASQVNAGFRRAILRPSDADLRFIIFADTDLIDQLGPAIKRRLLRKFETGRLILGAEGYGRDLKQALGLITPDLYDAGTNTGGEGSWVLLHRSAKGHLNELTISAPEDRAMLQTAFHHARDWFAEPAVARGDAG